MHYAIGPESVVEDQRPPQLGRQIHASIRHQSTLRYYPLRWRLIYALTIVSSLLLFALLFAGIGFPWLLPSALAALGVRVALEGTTLALFCRRLRYRATPAEFLLAEFCLPFYLLVRPLLVLFPVYRWRERAHSASAPTARPMP